MVQLILVNPNCKFQVEPHRHIDHSVYDYYCVYVVQLILKIPICEGMLLNHSQILTI